MLDEPLTKVLGPATAKVMAEYLDLHTVEGPAAPLPPAVRRAR